MALDIRGSLKNTKINANHYVAVDELFSNALDSFLIRKKRGDVANFEVFFDIEFFDEDSGGKTTNLNIKCFDNGAGLGDDQTKAFVTKDTSYKDGLGIEGIGKCKGSGRIQFLHYFKKITLDSTYQSNEKKFSRKLTIDENTKEVDLESFEEKEVDGEIRTCVALIGLKKEILEKISGDNNGVIEEFSANSLKQHLVISFLQRLVSLKEGLGDFLIKFKSKYNDDIEESSLTAKDLPTVKKEIKIEVISQDSEEKKYEFLISHYELKKSEYNLKKNTVALCAKSSIVLDITKRYLKTKSLENNDVNGLYHIVLIESDFLDTKVNEQRDGFDMSQTISERLNDLFAFDNPLSFEEIYNKVDDVVIEMLCPPDWDKEKIIKSVADKYGISPRMLTDAKVRIHYGDSEESVVKRTLTSYQERIIEETSEIFCIKKEISESVPDSEVFREKINELAWKYTSSLKNIDMANLSQLVVRRAAILEVLSLAVKQELECQKNNTDKKKKNESLIHSIFFPMKKDSVETSEHDIWILNEEYHYYDYISSDKPLSKITFSDNQLLFESDIDDNLDKILGDNAKRNSNKRPDIAIFSKAGAVIIVEFKAPGVMMDEHIGDLMEYSQLLAAKSKGKLNKFYGYLIGTDINQNRITGYNKFPNGKGWFSTAPIVEHTTGKRLGELYSEIIFYEDIVSRASTRLEVYRNKLGFNLDPDLK